MLQFTIGQKTVYHIVGFSYTGRKVNVRMVIDDNSRANKYLDHYKMHGTCSHYVILETIQSIKSQHTTID
jgi:hypothetical protein